MTTWSSSIRTLIEKAAQEVDYEDADKLSKKMMKGKFDYDDYLAQMQQMQKMGGIGAIMNMLPGSGFMGLGKMKGNMPDPDESEKQLKKIEAMIYSMTPYERSHPDALTPQRKIRIAKGAGLSMDQVNRMVKQFNESRKMMKQMTGMMKGKRGRFKLPF